MNGIVTAVSCSTTHSFTKPNLIRKAGIMAIVITGGEIWPGDVIIVELPSKPYKALEPV